MSSQAKIKRDPENKTITVSRELNGPLEKVWRAYTEKELLAQWWSPAPWKLETKEMDFRPGGHWLYAMVGPENQKHWSKMNYLSVHRPEKIEMEDFFCDENGRADEKMPISKGEMLFSKTDSGTKVDFRIGFPTVEALNQTVQMGFEEGMSQCLDQLDALLTANKI
ncbi:MAG TPA: SRPBCC domain-containing protein [Pseudobdellovibrionaceae bacterium]|nr:SRPBCC domain-containing protein [Pseudobdellovibrionaceae bacterium]